MSQKRFIDFGTGADASKVKTIHRQLFAPQVLRADDPFFSALAPDQLIVQPHAVMFESGVILVEDEVLSVTINTTFTPANYTIYYEHIDEDQIGGSSAQFKTTGGLQQALANSVILGWVVYPGGSVPLSNSMLYVNAHGQVQPGVNPTEIVRNDGGTILFLSGAVTAVAAPLIENTVIPSISPYQITQVGVFLSKLLPIANQGLRVFNSTGGVDLARVIAAPALGQYSVNVSTDVYTFNALDAGKSITLFDATYGNARKVSNTSPTLSGIIQRLFSFEVGNMPIRSLLVEYIALAGSYTIDPVEVFDVNLAAATLASSKAEPAPIDGTISRLTVRLVEGIFSGTSGEQFTLRLKETLGPSSSGLLLRVRASAYDLPF